jgi:hypothetical protein
MAEPCGSAEVIDQPPRRPGWMHLAVRSRRPGVNVALDVRD